MKRWFRRRLNGDTGETLARADARLVKAKAETPMVHKAARKLARLPDDDFVALVAQAFRRLV